MGLFSFGRDAIMDLVAKKKLKRQSDQTLLSQVKKKIAQPRAAESTRGDECQPTSESEGREKRTNTRSEEELKYPKRG